MALALGLMAVGVAALLLVPALLEDETKAPDPYTEAAPAGRCPAAVSPDAVRCEMACIDARQCWQGSYNTVSFTET